MDGFVLDASVAISWCFPNDPTENTAYSRAVLEHLETADVIVPEVWAFEIANGIFVAHSRRKRTMRPTFKNTFSFWSPSRSGW